MATVTGEAVLANAWERAEGGDGGRRTGPSRKEGFPLLACGKAGPQSA